MTTTTETIYTGSADREACEWLVRKNGVELDPAPSLTVRRHSPDGFSWGYAGSGPAQLALALLLEEAPQQRIAERLYQTFKRDVVSRWPIDGDWRITSGEIQAWLREHPVEPEPDDEWAPVQEHVNRLPCGCPIDSGCTGHHTDGGAR